MSKRLFVGNLSFETKNETLSAALTKVAPVAECLIRHRGEKSLGYAFAEMGTEEGAQQVVAALNGKEIDGRPIKVEFAKEPVKQPKKEAAEPGPDGERKKRKKRRRARKVIEVRQIIEVDCADEASTIQVLKIVTGFRDHWKAFPAEVKLYRVYRDQQQPFKIWEIQEFVSRQFYEEEHLNGLVRASGVSKLCKFAIRQVDIYESEPEASPAPAQPKAAAGPALPKLPPVAKSPQEPKAPSS